MLLQEEFGSASLFVVKDPRICRFVPFWLRNLAADSIDPAAVITVRSPLEVAQSLAARDGLSLEHALLLWLRHVLEAERETRSISRSFVCFQDLLLDWKAIARQTFTDIGLQWPDVPDLTDAEIAGFLQWDLRHHAIGIDALSVAPPLLDWVKQTDAAFARLLTRDPASTREALQMLDDVGRDFDRSSDAFGFVVDDVRRAHRQAVLNLELERIELRRHASHVEAERDEFREAASTVDVQLAQLRQHASQLEVERDQFQERCDQLARELAQTRMASDSTLKSLSERLATSEMRVQSLLQSLSWRWMHPFALRFAFG